MYANSKMKQNLSKFYDQEKQLIIQQVFTKTKIIIILLKVMATMPSVNGDSG
jgi:hypothetical protein